MKRMAFVIALTVASLAAAVAIGRAQEKGRDSLRPLPQTAEWRTLQSLVGEWDGTFEEGGQKLAAHLEVRATGDGSALMHVMGKGTPHEMVTMIHPDGERLLATHYCAAHNQPRMALTKSPAPNQVVFDFIDGTNIRPGDGHMARVAFIFLDADHHDEAWTYRVNGKDAGASTFHFARKK